jgi:signal transduction histidine kinase
MALSNRNSRITMQLFLLRDRKRIDSLVAARAENSRRISVSLGELETLCKSDEERRLLLAIKNARSEYVASYLQALDLLLQKRNYAAAADVMVGQSSPALTVYHDAWDQFVRFEAGELERAARESRARNTRARRLALLSVIIAVLLGGAIALVVTRSIVREVTTRLTDEQETVRMAHQEAEVFINAVPSILIGLSRDARITRWNQAAARVFAIPEPEVMDKTITDCGIRWLRPDMGDEVRTWLSSDVALRCDQAPFDIKGEARLLGLTITPVHVTDQHLTKFLVIGSDTTNRTNLEAQLRQAQKLESVGQLAAGIAHEINTPTQYIGDNVRFLKDSFGNLQTLMSKYQVLLTSAQSNTLSREGIEEVSAAVQATDTGYLLEEIPKAIDQTLEGVTRVSTLVNAMKEFSHPGTKEKVNMDLNRAIQSTITVARNEWKYVAEVETDYEVSLPMIACLPGEFNQVILNMIVNAAHSIADVIKAGSSEKGTIKVQTRDLEEWIEIRIQDSGAGIPEHVRARIFDPFFTTKEIGKGTGQGLAIARSVIVDKHAGTIHFETAIGKGTTFIIRLPRDGKAQAAKAGPA